MNQQNLKYQLLADLLATLEAEEFPIGVGKHLELQQLYSMLPEEIAPEEMKTLLAPIFAKNKQDQEFFYDIFEQSLRRVKSKTWVPKNQSRESTTPKKSKWEIIAKLLGIVLLAIAATFIYLRFSKKEPAPLPVKIINNEALKIKEDTTFSIRLLEHDSLEKPSFQSITNDSLPLVISFENGELVGVIPNVGNYQIDSLGIFTLKTEKEIAPISDTIKVISNYKGGKIKYNLLYFGAEESNSGIDTSTIDFLEFREHPYPKDLTRLFPKAPPIWITFFQEYKYWIKPIIICLLFALFGALLKWWAERQQKIIADIQSKNDPPLLWNIQIPNVSKINLNEDYFKVLQLMRQRTSDDHFVLNIPKTINKTIETGGIVDFQYQYKTRPPEYLLLIDRQSSKNHRAYLYNYLFESFKANEVYIERFFFEGDIRLCWNEYYPNGIKLQDLQQTFRDSRLIIVGSGYQLLNPVTGKMAKWTRIFDNWTDRAILSPRPTKQWAGREKQLEQKFILLPASIQSLTAMVDKMEAIDPDEIKSKINDQVNEPIEFRGNLIDTLHHYFSIKKEGLPRDESLVHWIAACAIYPTLHWDLTMYLGQELSTEDKNLLTFDHINQLTRLPWFVEGKIPEQARLELLEYLPEEVEIHLRKSLSDLFESIPPPDENSVAFADSRINISLNKYLLEKNNLLKTEIDQYARAGADIDVTMLKYLEGEKSPKDFEVDPNLRRYAEGEKPKLGMDRWSKILAFLLFILSIGILTYNPDFENCKGELVQFKELELCLKTSDDFLTYRGAQMRDAIQQNNYNPIDSLEQVALKKYFVSNSGKLAIADYGKVQQAEFSVESIFPFVKNDTSILHFYQNLAVDFYNHGVPSYNRFDSLGKSVDEYYRISGDSVKFCTAFGDARFYDNLIYSSVLTAELEGILDLICFVPPIPDTTNNIKILARKIGGKVYDNDNRTLRLNGVEVEFFGQKVLTNERGRYELNVPPIEQGKDYELTFTKNKYQKVTKKYSRNKFSVFQNVAEEPLQLENIYMKEIPIDLTCYKKNLTSYETYIGTGTIAGYEEALKSIQKAKSCPTGEIEKSNIARLEIKINELIKREIQNEQIISDPEQEAWKITLSKNTIDDFQSFLRKFPNGKYANEAQKLIREIIPSDAIRYGDIIILTDGYQNLNLLTCGKPLGSTTSSLVYGVHTGDSKATDAQWIIESGNSKKVGDPILAGDIIYLQNKYYNRGGYLDIVGQMTGSCSNYLHHVNTSAEKATSWIITSNTRESKFIKIGETVQFKNEVGTKGWLGSCGTSSCINGNVAGISPSEEDGKSRTTYWRITKL